MDLTTRKNKFIERFEQIKDSNILERFEEFLEMQLSSKKIVAFTVEGEPLTKEMYIKKIKASEASVIAGNYTTTEDLEKEIENW